MALIKCPECGHEVSDKAGSCPFCGYPIAKQVNKGKIKVKLGMYPGIGGTQSVTITSSDGKELWSGDSGQVAEFEVPTKTNVEIHYGTNAMHFGGTCSGTIDPDKNNKYAVAIRQGMFKTVPTFQSVDVIDSE